MDYVEINVPVGSDERSDIIMALLSDFPFESFVQEKDTLKGYIPKERLIDCKTDIDALLAEEAMAGVKYIEIETQNWNAVWESNFEPVEIEGVCTVRAPFSPAPSGGLDIVIMPKMSFGTGHHATTWLMTAEIMKLTLDGRRGLDMGSGTGILSIAAVKHGAAHMDAVDIDDWAYENGIENFAANGVSDNVTPILGDMNSVRNNRYDFILANINLNILKADMNRYAAALNVGGDLLMSGVMEQDTELLGKAAESTGLVVKYSRVKDGWAMVRAVKD